MKHLLCMLCLLSASGARAQVCPAPDYPRDCYGLCRRVIKAMEVFRPRGFDCRYDILPFTREELDWMQWGCDYDAYYYHTEAECQYAFRWIQRWDIDPIPQEPTCSDYVDHAIAEEIGNERVARTAECMRTHPFWDGCFCGHPGDGC